MSPSKCQDGDVTKGTVNGQRPSPLRITKESHHIHKTTSSSSSSSSAPHQMVIENSSSYASGAKHHSLSSSAKRQPVIIYTHSPKVIHAQARDFMALVQKLTGLTRSEDEKAAAATTESNKDESSFTEEKDNCGRTGKNVAGSDQGNESCSVLTAEIKQDSSAAVSPIYKPSNPYLMDPPVFGPNSSELFCSSRSNSLFQTPSIANSISAPAIMEYMKGVSEY